MKIEIFFFLLSATLLACHPADSHKEEDITLMATEVGLKDTVVFKEYVCQIRAIQHIELRTLEKGYLNKINTDEGQIVREGQLLFQIKPVIYQSEVAKARAEVGYAEMEYLNTKRLADSNIVSKNELALAKAKLDKARAELSLSEAHLSFTEIRAPFNGIVGRFNETRLGSLMEEGDLLTTLSDNSRLWVYFNVPESEYLDYVSSDRKVNALKVKLQMANSAMYPLEGQVETIEADFNNETGNISFRAVFENPDRLLRHGETGNIHIPVYLKNVMVIPQIATFEILDKKYVYVIDAENRVQAREIETGSEIQHLYIVSKGLKPGDRILTDGIRKVKNGQKVRYHLRSVDSVLLEMSDLYAE